MIDIIASGNSYKIKLTNYNLYLTHNVNKNSIEIRLCFPWKQKWVVPIFKATPPGSRLAS